MSSFLFLFLIIFSSVLLIVINQRFKFEKELYKKFGIDRDWWVPIIALFLSILVSIVDLTIIQNVLIEKIDIIILIFSFGILSEGLGSSGFFTYISYKIVRYGNSNTKKLIIYIFVMTSIATYFTSNDIVILVLTPIIIEICFHAKIRNMKLILLTQFVAANTISMGMILGSPTNIIIAETLNIDFFTYLALMIVPSIIAFSVSLIIVFYIASKYDKLPGEFFSSLSYDPKYEIPDKNPQPNFTKHMRNWIIIMIMFLSLVAIVTYLQISLLYCAIPSIIISITYWIFSDNHQERVSGPVKRLPYGILFFGMTFFILASSFVQTNFVGDSIIPLIQSSIDNFSPLVNSVWIIGTGIIVNVFNDLPSSAIIAEIITQLEFPTLERKIIFTQSILIGLNIGAYITQVGALAGLIWFNQIRVHRKKHDYNNPDKIVFPKRLDMIKYGFLHFTIVSIICSLYLVLEWLILVSLI